MTAATIMTGALGKKAYKVTATSTIGNSGGAILEKIICVASSSGTLALADGNGTITTTALSLAAKDVLDVNLPVQGTLTATVGGTLEAILVFG